MKNLSVQQKKQIVKVISLIAKSSVLPVLEQACITGGNLSFTDLTHSVVFKNIGIEQSFLLDAKDFSKVLLASDKSMSMEVKGDIVQFKIGKRTYSLSSTPIDDFPKIPVPDAGKAVFLGELTDKDKQKIQLASKTVSNDELRPAMTNVCIGGSDIVATDAHVLYFDRIDYRGEQILLSPKTVKLLKIFEDQSFNISRINSLHIAFENSDVCITVRPCADKFPDYKAVIPNDLTNCAYFSKSELNEVAKNAQDFLGSDWVSSLTFDLNGSAIISGDEKFASKSFSVTLDNFQKIGVDIKIGFNAKLLQKALSFINIDEVSMRYSEPSRAAVLNNKVLLMPVKLLDYV